MKPSDSVTPGRESVFSALLENLIKHGVPVFFLLIALLFYLQTYDSCQIKITVLQLGGTALLALWLMRSMERPRESLGFFKENLALVLPFVLLLVSGVFSHLVMSPLVKASGMELYRRVIYMGIALLVIQEFNSSEKIDRLVRWLFVAAFLASFYGFVQLLDWHFFPPNPEPGLDPFIWRGAFRERVFSTFGNPNFYGDFLVVMAPVILARFMKTRNPVLLVLWAMVFLNGIFTYSKGAWIGLIAGFVFFWLFYALVFVHRNADRIRKFAAAGIILVVVGGGAGVWYQMTQRTDSAKFRINTWLSCWEMINTSPILGTGIGTFYVTYPAWRRPQIFYIEYKHNTESDHPENEYLEVWYDEGLVGFGIFLWLLVTVIVAGVRTMHTYANPVPGEDNRVKNNERYEDDRAFYLLGFISGWMASLTHNFVCVSARFVSSGSYLWLFAGVIVALIVHNPLPRHSRTANVLSPVVSYVLWSAFWLLNFLWWFVRSDMAVSDRDNQVSLAFGLVFFFVLLPGVAEYLTRYGRVDDALRSGSSTGAGGPWWRRVPQVAVVVIAVYLFGVFRGYFQADLRHNIAIWYSKQGKWMDALTNYQQVAKLNPGFIMCHYFMGNVYTDRWVLQRQMLPELGDRIDDEPWTGIDPGKPGRVDPERALAKFSDVWRIAPNYVQSHHQGGVMYTRLADYYRSQGNEADALKYYQKALERYWQYHYIDPIFAPNYYRLAEVYHKIGRTDMVEKMYQAHLFTQWLCQSPDDVYSERTHLDRLSRPMEKSDLTWLLDQLHIPPDQWDMYWDRYKRERDLVVAELRELLVEAISKTRAYFGEERAWGCCDYHKREHYLIATQNWAARRDFEYSDTYLYLGDFYQSTGQFEKAERSYVKAIDRQITNFRAWKVLLGFYQARKEVDKLDALLQRYRRLFPNDRALKQLGAA